MYEVKGPLCPGMWVENPKITLSRNLGRLLKENKKKTGCSIREFCRRAGIPRDTIFDIINEPGKHWAHPGTLMKIASTLGVPIEVLFRR